MTKCMQNNGGGGKEETQEDGALLVNIWAVWNQGCTIKMKPLLVFQYLSLCLSQLPWLSLESSAQIAYTCPGPHYFHSLHSSRSTFTHLAAARAKQCHRGQRQSAASRTPLVGKWWQLFQKGWLIFQELQKRGRTQKKWLHAILHDLGSKRVESPVLTQPRALLGQLEQASVELLKLLPCSSSVWARLKGMESKFISLAHQAISIIQYIILWLWFCATCPKLITYTIQN